MHNTFLALAYIYNNATPILDSNNTVQDFRNVVIFLRVTFLLAAMTMIIIASVHTCRMLGMHSISTVGQFDLETCKWTYVLFSFFTNVFAMLPSSKVWIRYLEQHQCSARLSDGAECWEAHVGLGSHILGML